MLAEAVKNKKYSGYETFELGIKPFHQEWGVHEIIAGTKFYDIGVGCDLTVSFENEIFKAAQKKVKSQQYTQYDIVSGKNNIIDPNENLTVLNRMTLYTILEQGNLNDIAVVRATDFGFGKSRGNNIKSSNSEEEYITLNNSWQKIAGEGQSFNPDNDRAHTRTIYAPKNIRHAPTLTEYLKNAIDFVALLNANHPHPIHKDRYQVYIRNFLGTFQKRDPWNRSTAFEAVKNQEDQLELTRLKQPVPTIFTGYECDPIGNPIKFTL